MANRENHYEAAFEAYLRERAVPYVAVDEAKRSRFEQGTLKSLDFIVSPPGSSSWLVDVKGRRFPSGEQKHYWKNWSTRDDLISLSRWEQLFGAPFGGLFVFAYNIVGDRSPLAVERLFAFRGGLYGFVAIRLAEYARHARPISPRWDTLAMPVGRFRELAAPVEAFLFDCRQAAEIPL
ncbi:MAG: HYExAFE family protein [Pirellulales bacterium]